MSALLEVEDLVVRLGHHRIGQGGPRKILSGVGLSVEPGEIVGIIGETGSGKTTLARAILGLVRPESGTVRFQGRDLVGLKRNQLREFRRSGSLQLILQDPLRSLDPDYTVERLVGEGLTLRGSIDKAELEERIATTLRLVGLDPAIGRRRPGEISGGQRQRVSIARSLIVEPRLLICDEPVSALDASTRNYLLSILAKIREEVGVALLVISHDLSSIIGLADRTAVLFSGRIVEDGPVQEVFNRPKHPYSGLLLSSVPEVSRGWSSFSVPREVLRRPALRVVDEAVGGTGCAYAARCPFVDATCGSAEPALVASSSGHSVACFHADTWQERATDPLALEG